MIDLIQQYSSIVVILFLAFLFQALKEIGIPSPGMTQGFLVFAGVLISSGAMLFGLGIILFIFTGSLCGAFLIYHLGRLGTNIILEKLKHFARISPDAMEKAKNNVSKYSIITVSAGRSVPGMMVHTSIIAGTIKMPAGKFLAGILIPLSAWIALLTSLGASGSYFIHPMEVLPNKFLVLQGQAQRSF